jgi:hypothetical protein
MATPFVHIVRCSPNWLCSRSLEFSRELVRRVLYRSTTFRIANSILHRLDYSRLVTAYNGHIQVFVTYFHDILFRHHGLRCPMPCLSSRPY